jgi:hypothetical protein
MPKFTMHATYATKMGRQGARDVVREAPDIDRALGDFYTMLSNAGYSKIDITARPAANSGDPE